jgi:hypothetical protein
MGKLRYQHRWIFFLAAALAAVSFLLLMIF